MKNKTLNIVAIALTISILPSAAGAVSLANSNAVANAAANNNPVANAIAVGNAIVAQQGVTNVAGNVDIFKSPPSMVQTIESNNGGGAGTVTAFFGNEDAYQTTATDNGSGAVSVSNEYGDGWSGKGYNRLMYSQNNNVGNPGVQCYGFTLQYSNYTTGDESAVGINTAAPTILTANLVGLNQIPSGINLSQGLRNTQQLVGTMTIGVMFTMNSLTQFSYVVPKNSVASLTIMTTPLS